MSSCAAYPKCFGPYLQYAIATGFENFGFDEKTQKLLLLVELIKGNTSAKFVEKMKESGFVIELGYMKDDAPYATVRASKTAVVHPSAFCVWDEFVSRVELSLPLKPTSATGPNDRLNVSSQSKLVMGILDSGCPFAASRFLDAAGVTRVFSIWDQNEDRAPVPFKGKKFGEPPGDFGYGLEFRRHPISAGFMSLHDWMHAHRTQHGSIDEDNCYADAKFTSLQYRQSHGAHVMDLFAGSLPPASRVGPAVPYDPRDPPSWKPGNPNTDPTCKADIVFVQFPEKCLRDHTGVWLKAYVVDGIRYILACAGKADDVVINLSYGLTTGPHDGTSELEKALEGLVTEFDGRTRKPKLEIVVAAGNAYLTEGHVAFVGDGSQFREWTWRLPPDNTVLCFAEVWMKKGETTNVVVTLTSPAGISRPVIGPIDWGDNTMWLLEVDPTVAGSVAAAEHGDYRIKVANVAQHVEVNAYVARTDPNLNVRTGAKPSQFVDDHWKRIHSAKAAHTRADGEFERKQSLIDRYGTLNGLATGDISNVHVAGAYIYRRRDGRETPYTSSGFARGDPYTYRRGPDYALPGDDSYALMGVRGGGNRSGSVFRLIGTSAAAPQFARYFARGKPLPGEYNAPADPRRRGKGNLPPP